MEREPAFLDHRTKVTQVAFSPDGRTLATTADSGVLL